MKKKINFIFKVVLMKRRLIKDLVTQPMFTNNI
jgi:hypothetical protein